MSNDILFVLPICAMFLHVLTLLRMILHTALELDTPDRQQAEDRTLKALILGRAPVQRTACPTNSRLLTGSALLLATASAMSLNQGAAPVWTTTLAVLALIQLACAYAWSKPSSVNGAGPAEEATPDEPSEKRDDDPDDEDVTREPRSN
ncbi:hypothetical protein ACFWGI_06245 [Streptomyces niveus]|uniref:hypothetical protein n=1 Tax=Streptomyces niveus TaxID=193462 RepID=UPI003656D530